MRKLDADPFFQNLEAKGEEQAEVDLAANRYDERKTALATLWLARRERSRTDALSKEHAETASRAAAAAERAATAAEKANTRATIAAIAAAVIAIAAIIGLIFQWYQAGGD